MVKSRLLGVVGIVAIVGGLLAAQTPASRTFEVASIKPNDSGAAGGSGAFQPRGGFQTEFGSGGGGSRGVSTTAVAAIWSHDDPDHTHVLELLVLMRGAPGWYSSSGPGTNGYSFNISSGHSTNHAFATTGSVTVAIDSDSAITNKKLMVTSHLTTVFDQQFAPDSLNVVLVDGADTPAPIVQTELINPQLAGEGDALAQAIRSTPDLLNFIQCDAVPRPLPPNADLRLRASQAMATTFCRQMR
jgi:hypothetical protein